MLQKKIPSGTTGDRLVAHRLNYYATPGPDAQYRLVQLKNAETVDLECDVRCGRYKIL